MRSVVYKKNATTAVLLALMAILILLVYPLRVLKETHVVPGSGAVTRISDAVDRDHDAGGTFTASYAHLDHLDIYVESLEDCVQIEVRLFEPKEDGSFPMLAQQPVLIGEGEVPGFVSAEMDVDLVPGRDYVVTINCKYGSARIGFEEASDVPPSAEGKGPAAPVCRSAFYNDSTVDGAALAMAAHYRMPITMSAPFSRAHPMPAMSAACCPKLRANSIPVRLPGSSLQSVWIVSNVASGEPSQTMTIRQSKRSSCAIVASISFTTLGRVFSER